MSLKLGINGFGRIGSLTLRVAINKKVQVVAINDPFIKIEDMAYKLQFDSTHGKFDKDISFDDQHLIVDGNKIRVYSERNPENIKWKDHDVDIVIESTGVFLKLEQSQKHIDAGAKKVIISAPSPDAPMFVMGVNQHTYQKSMNIISNASCTTNALAPLAQIIHDRFGIEKGLMTTVHAVTSTQKTVDNFSNKRRLARGAFQNIIPSSTGAAKAVGKVIPALDGKLTGMAFRVPVADVSVVDLNVVLKTSASYKQVMDEFRKAAKLPRYSSFLRFSDGDLVSSDLCGCPASTVVDSKAGIMLDDRFVKLISWYDNEWGYSNRVVDLAVFVWNKDRE